jgi:hypothetical protein
MAYWRIGNKVELNAHIQLWLASFHHFSTPTLQAIESNQLPNSLYNNRLKENEQCPSVF